MVSMGSSPWCNGKTCSNVQERVVRRIPSMANDVDTERWRTPFELSWRTTMFSPLKQANNFLSHQLIISTHHSTIKSFFSTSICNQSCSLRWATWNMPPRYLSLADTSIISTVSLFECEKRTIFTICVRLKITIVLIYHLEKLSRCSCFCFTAISTEVSLPLDTKVTGFFSALKIVASDMERLPAHRDKRLMMCRSVCIFFKSDKHIMTMNATRTEERAFSFGCLELDEMINNCGGTCSSDDPKRRPEEEWDSLLIMGRKESKAYSQLFC